MRILGEHAWGPPPDHENAIAVLKRAVELGVDLIDTAAAYGPHISEELIREALHPYRSVTIATKGGLLRPGPDRLPEPVCGLPDYLRQEIELSLRRLGVERIDLWQLHRIDPKVPAEEQFGVLREALDAGKVRHVGLSEVSIEELETARRIVPISTVSSNLDSLEDRSAEDLLDHCGREGIGFMPWRPLALGELGRPGGVLAEAAARRGSTPRQIALAWFLQRSAVMLPIPGTGSIAHLEENVRAAAVQLTEAEAEAIDAATVPSARRDDPPKHARTRITG